MAGPYEARQAHTPTTWSGGALSLELASTGFRFRRPFRRAHNVSPHDLRHTAASLAVRAGGHVKAVQRMLGHSSAAMTLDVYQRAPCLLLLANPAPLTSMPITLTRSAG